jgi:hypothetical protein
MRPLIHNPATNRPMQIIAICSAVKLLDISVHPESV